MHKSIKYVAIDVLVRSSMNSAAKCSMQCDLYDSVNLEKLEHILCNLIITECVHVSVCTVHSNVFIDAIEWNICQHEHVNSHDWL